MSKFRTILGKLIQEVRGTNQTAPNTVPAQQPNTVPAQQPNTVPAQQPNTVPAQTIDIRSAGKNVPVRNAEENRHRRDAMSKRNAENRHRRDAMSKLPDQAVADQSPERDKKQKQLEELLKQREREIIRMAERR